MIAVAAAFAVSLAIVAVVLRRPAWFPADRPNERSLHERPVPRAGGWAIVGGAAVAALLAPSPAGAGGPAFGAMLGAAGLLAIVSAIDDRRGLSPLVRLAVQVGCAAGAAFALAPAAPPAIVAAGALAAVAGANFYNFMDGSDGLAATMAVAGFGALAAGSALAGASGVFAAALVAATVPFLAVNRPPARMFMGDAGSVPLGFLAAMLGFAGVLAGAWGAWFPLLAFLPFVADAAATLARRGLRGEAVWRAHRTHYYQRFAVAGAGHRGTLALWGALMAGCAATAVGCLAWRPAAGPAALGAWAAIHALVFAAIDYHGRSRA